MPSEFPLQPQKRLTLSTSATPFGCCNYFDICTDELLSLTYRGSLGLLDWLPWTVTEDCYRSVEFIVFRRPDSAGASVGYLSDACADPNGWEFGTRALTVEDFGLMGRKGPVRQILKPKYYCKSQPRYRLDGSLVTSEQEWDMLFTTGQILDDMRSMIVVGSAATPGQFDGLEQWVSMNHHTPLDAWVVDWNGNPLAGGAGITINGDAIGATWDLITVLLSLFRKIRQRISWSPEISGAQIALGDMALVLPTFAAQCLLDAFTCWSVCTGTAYNEVNLQTMEARIFRNSLVAADNPANLYGYGYITLDGTTIPLLVHDWELIQTTSTFDMYFLTRYVGGRKIWDGEFLSAEQALSTFAPTIPSGLGVGDYFTLDGGRVLGKYDTDNLCYTLKEWHAPRMFCLAPWMQIRFSDITCHDVGDPLSPDPASSFYIDTSFSAATCP